jgi:DeoR/GlpR family transcriptional regulator of sugar metabolism
MIKDLNSTLVRRHEELLLVDTKGKISVDELARYLGVSDDTIRRDLQNLEQRKLLLRTHGGAISIVLLAQETPFVNRTNAHVGAKSRIGREAAKLICDGETLIVNGGSTTFAFAANLRTHRNLTVVTDNVAMLSILPPEALQDVYLLGGQYRLDLGSTMGLVGFSSEAINVDTAVLGVIGLTAKDGISATLLEEASMLGQMIRRARRAIVAADGSKFGVNAIAQIAPLDIIDILVSDVSPPPDFCQALNKANVELIVTPF